MHWLIHFIINYQYNNFFIKSTANIYVLAFWWTLKYEEKVEFVFCFISFFFKLSFEFTMIDPLNLTKSDAFNQIFGVEWQSTSAFNFKVTCWANFIDIDKHFCIWFFLVGNCPGDFRILWSSMLSVFHLHIYSRPWTCNSYQLQLVDTRILFCSNLKQNFHQRSIFQV